MFAFFRRYQRAIYFVITAVIILSFSFFGTYSAFTSGRGDDPVVLRTEDGTKVTRSEYNEYVHFLSTDSQASESGPYNALNDGVIPDDIIATGIGEILAKRFASDVGPEWKQKFAREKTFQPYHHPRASFMSAMRVWNFFAPDMKKSFERFSSLNTDDPVELYRCKASLYLAEKNFSSAKLRQMLIQQQQQLPWLEPDTSLETRPLGLFGYNQNSDWFGAQFIDKVCELIIQTAGKARQSGCQISSSEVLASLLQNAERVVKQLPPSEAMTVDELFRRTLRELNIDQARAIAIWSDVLLFRRSLVDLPRDIVVNDQPFRSFMERESDTREMDCYQLQPCLRCGSMRDLYKIQAWLRGVAPQSGDGSLALPQAFLSPEEVSITYPEFVERRFVLNVSAVTGNELFKNIRVRDIWNWEVEDENWAFLVKEIPSLASETTPDSAERTRLLDGLSPQLRSRADMIAREHILSAHPEWVEKALEAAKPKVLSVGIRLKGPLNALVGIENRQALIDELIKAPLGEPSPALKGYTQDKKHFYSIQVMDRSQTETLVSLPDLLADGSLERVLDRVLEGAYPTIREDRPSDFRKGDDGWKPFAEVKERVAEAYFVSFINKLDEAIDAWKGKIPAYSDWTDAKSARAAVRFLPQLSSLGERLRSGDESACTSVPFGPSSREASVLEERDLKDLWLLVKSHERVLRRDLRDKPHFSEAFFQNEGSWLPARYSQAFGPFVAKVTKKDVEPFEENVRAAVFSCQKSLGREAVQARTEQLVGLFFPEKKAEARANGG